jgi:hypothetical protein
MFSATESIYFRLAEYIEICKSVNFERRKSVDFTICTSKTVNPVKTLMVISI